MDDCCPLLSDHLAQAIGVICGANQLMNSAIARAGDPVRMAVAMQHAIKAGSLAYLVGRMPRRMGADPSNPLTGLIR